MDIPIELVALLGVILAVLGRTILPYLKKVHEDPSVTFDWGYLGTMFFSGVVSAVVLYPTFVMPGNLEWWNVFIVAFIFAWTANDVTNRIAK